MSLVSISLSARGDDHDRDVDIGELIDAEARVADHPEDQYRENDHRRQDRAANADTSQPLHADLLLPGSDAVSFDPGTVGEVIELGRDDLVPRLDAAAGS